MYSGIVFQVQPERGFVAVLVEVANLQRQPVPMRAPV